jgi:glyoxylase I family protein
MTIDRRSLVLGGSALAALGASRATESAPLEHNVQPPKERVSGIGGLAEWYQRHLGIDPTPTSLNQPVWRQEAGPTVFAPFPLATKYFGSPQQAWMVNFRVRNLDAMAAQLRDAGIAVDINAEVDSTGRFARVHDPDGNPIELWEPAGPAR